MSTFPAPRLQGWLRFKNAGRFGVFVSVNALTPGRVPGRVNALPPLGMCFLVADREADRVLSDNSAAVKSAGAVLCRAFVSGLLLWRACDLSVERAEPIQKHLARELRTDVAATSASQTRLPGFFNHKYLPAPLVEVD